jgi:hypothetical protein
MALAGLMVFFGLVGTCGALTALGSMGSPMVLIALIFAAVGLGTAYGLFCFIRNMSQTPPVRINQVPPRSIEQKYPEHTDEPDDTDDTGRT